MASPNPQYVVEPPRKRPRLSPQPSSSNTTTTQHTANQGATMDGTIKQTVMSDNGFQPEREAQVGILHFVNASNPGFSGILKQRYVVTCFWFTVCSLMLIKSLASPIPVYVLLFTFAQGITLIHKPVT
jgi:hypothetical protein